MATHAEASDWHVVLADWEKCGNYSRKLLGNIGEHLEMFLIFIGSSVNVEASRVSEFPIAGNSFNISVSGTSVREYYGNPVLLGMRAKSWFYAKVLMVWSKSSKAVEGRVWLSSLSINVQIWKVYHKVHEAIHRFTPMWDSVESSSAVSDITSYFDLLLLNLWRSRDFNNCSEAITAMEYINGFIDLLKTVKLMGHILFNRPFSKGCLIDQLWYIFNALPSTESSSKPFSACHQLEWSSWDLFSSLSHTDHAGFSPSSMSSL